MKLHPIITQANGIISVQIQALFAGDTTDATDKQKIAAFGDPQINIGGTFTDPSNPSFVFQFPVTEMYVGLTTQLASQTARFMEALPQPQNPNQPAPIQGPLDCVTENPSEAAQAYINILIAPGSGRVAQAMLALRSQMILPVIADTTV